MKHDRRAMDFARYDDSHRLLIVFHFSHGLPLVGHFSMTDTTLN